MQPDIAPIWQLRPRLATKLHRPYVSSEWNSVVKLAALLGHYDALSRLFSPTALQAIYAAGLDAVTFTTRSSRRLALRFSYADQFEKEGELTLGLIDLESGLNLAGVTFVLTGDDHARVLIIGGLQANPDPRTRELIHDVAKEMFGLRPKAFALWCVQQCAASWGVARIEAVCDAQHIYRHWRKQRAIAASYDEFWAESDGEPLPGGGWRLPLQARERSRAELKPTRRKQHEQRYAALHALRPVLVAALARLAPAAPAPNTAAAPFVFAEQTPDTPPATAAA